jgi:hypothetical protein
MIKQKLLKKNNILRIFDDKQILVFEDKDILIIDYIADCCLFDQEFIIFNVNPFEDIVIHKIDKILDI